MSAIDLAVAIKTSRGQIYQLENGARQPWVSDDVRKLLAMQCAAYLDAQKNPKKAPLAIIPHLHGHSQP